MIGRRIAQHLALLAAAGFLLAARQAAAQMVPISDARTLDVHADYNGISDVKTVHPSAPFAHFDAQAVALAEQYGPCDDPPGEQCLIGQCNAVAIQNSDFFPAAIQFTGATSASWGVPPAGSWSFESSVKFHFRVDTAFDYQLFATVDPGDWPSLGAGLIGGDVTLEAPGGLVLTQVTDNTVFLNGRLGPGEYVLSGRSTGGAGSDPATADFQGAAYGAQWLVTPVAQPIITTQPTDRTIPCGGSVSFAVATSGPAANYTYQWRKNLVPVVNGPHLSGANTNTLVLSAPCYTDAGSYDVVVSGTVNGSPVNEPSRLARLQVVGTAGVGDEVVAAFTLSVASPNPFRGATSLRYAVPRPTRLTASVYNVAGARVRALVDDVVSGSGVVSWDGNDQSGARAPRGMYFVRADAGGVRVARQVVRLD